MSTITRYALEHKDPTHVHGERERERDPTHVHGAEHEPRRSSLGWSGRVIKQVVFLPIKLQWCVRQLCGTSLNLCQLEAGSQTIGLCLLA